MGGWVGWFRLHPGLEFRSARSGGNVPQRFTLLKDFSTPTSVEFLTWLSSDQSSELYRRYGDAAIAERMAPFYRSRIEFFCAAIRVW